MAQTLNGFKKKKNYLLCVDSDGCAMDTMNVKHFRCFGPCFADEWHISARESVLKRWNEINLYRLTRGINRFKGLAQILCELYPGDNECASFKAWTDTAKELSESSVQAQIDAGGGEVFKKALSWSQATNRAIKALPDGCKTAFNGVREALAAAHVNFDIAIVSSANYDAVRDEWERCGLLEHADCITTQRDGSKARCIAGLVKKGYVPANAVMVGDAPGDLDAAEKNGVSFYPILVGHEEESWGKINDVLNEFLNGGKIDLKMQFIENLS